MLIKTADKRILNLALNHLIQSLREDAPIYGGELPDDHTPESAIHAASELQNTIDDKRIQLKYVSIWEDGTIETTCTVDLLSMQIVDIEALDTQFEHFKSEHIEVVSSGSIIQVGVENGELTEQGKKTLGATFSQFIKILS